MATVSVVYFSGSGHTATMAEAVARGAASVAGVKANLVAIQPKEIRDGRWKNEAALAQLDVSDAIVFGTPTYMGGPSAQFKAFADSTSARWAERKWLNKIGAGFTVSGGLSGDKLNTLVYLCIFAMQHGMVWLGQDQTPFNEKGINRLSSYVGAMGQAYDEPPDVAPNEADRLTGEALGRRVAEATRRWGAGKP